MALLLGASMKRPGWWYIVSLGAGLSYMGTIIKVVTWLSSRGRHVFLDVTIIGFKIYIRGKNYTSFEDTINKCCVL